MKKLGFTHLEIEQKLYTTWRQAVNDQYNAMVDDATKEEVQRMRGVIEGIEAVVDAFGINMKYFRQRRSVEE